MRDSSTILEELERKCPDWDPAVLELLRYMPSQVVDWGLRWRDPSRNWVSQGGHTIALGDAAHTFLPTAGNGAVQALEDAISLAECLRLGGKQQVPASNKIHNALRFQRVSVLQQTGFVNREELHHADIEAIAQHPTSAVGFFKIGRWVWGHDAEVYATENYYACSRAIQEGLEFQNTNLPPGHLYHDWNMASENQRMMAGVHSDLKNNGDWGS